MKSTKLRIHLLALPNAQTTAAYSLCGFAQATIRFAKLLKSLGHTVILYASEENEAPCDELVTVITKEEQQTFLDGLKGDPTPYQYAYIEEWSPIWQLANGRTVKEIAKRKQPRDLICTIGGTSQQPVANAHPELMCVEYSIGYNGSFSKFRVFESYAWMHNTYGVQGTMDGRFFDTVIPLFYETVDFKFRDRKEPFALYVGRVVPRKGIFTACKAAAIAGVPLKVIGHGNTGFESLITDGAEYLGALDNTERNEWMSRASVVLTPTQYIEPFNQVAVEAQMCGTPVISTDFGGFVETVEQGKTGMRCSYLGEFAEGIRMAFAGEFDHQYIRERAVRLYGMENVKHQYRTYFERLQLLWGKGWATETPLSGAA